MKQNNSGMSMLLVIAALLVTGFIGTSLIKMATADRLSGIYFSSSESARSAAKSGLTAALVRIGSTQQATKDSILAILNNYMKTPNPDTLSNATNYKKIWINGGPNSAPSDKQWQSLSSGSVEKFRTRIDAFRYNGPNDCYITLVSEGIGAGGSKSSAMGVYQLTNLGLGTTTSNVPTNAIQMDNGAFEFNVNLVVNGNTSLKNGMDVNSTGQSTFNGTFRLDSLNGTAGVLQFTNGSGRYNFKQNSYFACLIRTDANLTFERSAGVNGGFDMPPSKTQFGSGPRTVGAITVRDSFFIRGGCDDKSWSGTFDMDQSYLKYIGTASEYKAPFDDFSASSPSGVQAEETPKFSIPTALHLPLNADPAIYFDTTKLGTPHKIIPASGMYTAADLNTWYDSVAATGTLLNNTFLVVRISGTNTSFGIFGTSATKFRGKAVIWVDNARNIVGDMVETTSDANLSFYIKSASDNQDHFQNTPYLRGFIYVGSCSSDFFFEPGISSHFVGSVYGSAGARFQFNGGSTSGITQTISYNSDAINELAAIGVFNDPSTSTSSGLILTGSRIAPVVRSHAM